MKHTLKEWIATTRYWSFSVSALPVVATTAYLCATREVSGNDLFCALLAVVGVVLFHAAGNLLSDVGDFRSGADSREAFAIPNLVEQIQKRARDFEKSIRIDYLQGLNDRYEEWIKGYKGNLIIIDGDTMKFENDIHAFQHLTDMIDAKLYGLFPMDSE